MKLERARKLIREYGYNSSTGLGLVSLGEKVPFQAYWPMRFTQIVGGKRWSLSLCIFRTEKPLLVGAVPPKTFLSEDDPRQ